MSITDELRELADVSWIIGRSASRTVSEIIEIADRIDAEHEKSLDEQFKALTIGMEPMTDENMAKHGWIRLPKDANDEYIHIWGRMEHIELGYVCEVIAVGVDCFIAWNTHANRYCQYDSKLFRHHHEQTVEDVLRQVIACANNGTHVHGALDTEQIIAEYAAKLQLRGDGE